MAKGRDIFVIGFPNVVLPAIVLAELTTYV